MENQRKEKRDRLLALAFVSILMVLVYVPLAPVFVSADRLLFDAFSRLIKSDAPAEAMIISIDPERKSSDELLNDYGTLVQRAVKGGARRIVLASPPELPREARLPGWTALLSGDIPVYVPADHRFADVAVKTGVLKLEPDADQVLRSSDLWHLEGSSMKPSLPLAIALDDPAVVTSMSLAASDDTVFLTSYPDVPHMLQRDVLKQESSILQGKTVFIDADLPLIGAAALIPAGQYLTRSQVTALLLGNIEHNQAVTAPAWIGVMQWLAPALLAIFAVLFLPGRTRRDIVMMTFVTIIGLVVASALLLFIARFRIDLGRAIVIFLGAAALSWWLAGTVRKAAEDAFRRGSDFLAAGRLEPAFAEFRRCEPTDTVASAMYKLSLAFEQQAKPERAEAVLEWLKRVSVASQKSMGNQLAASGKNPPQRLGRYVIERRVGRGAMGAVYLARDPRINRAVALKVIPIEKEFEDEELEEARLRFFREAESAGRLTHPNIITVFDAGEDKHLAYIAMEYLPGIQLTKYTDPKKLLAPSRSLELCARTAAALDYAHSQGVIHRDIKPANLLYNPREDMLKISDFGVARLTDNNSTKTGIVLGTPMYMSPEQLNAEDLTGQSDLFSLGVTLYELLAGEVPFKATNLAVLMTKITTEEPVPVSTRRPGVPPSVDQALMKALAKRPEDRYSCGAEMAEALRNCAKNASV